MEVFDFMKVSPNSADGTGFACARMADEGGVEVWVKMARGLEPYLLLQNRRDGRDGRPLAPDDRGL